MRLPRFNIFKELDSFRRFFVAPCPSSSQEKMFINHPKVGVIDLGYPETDTSMDARIREKMERMLDGHV